MNSLSPRTRGSAITKHPKALGAVSGSPQITQDAGREWLIEGNALALVVPSAIVPRETNVILNASHPQFARVQISKAEPFSLDERLWR